MASKLSGDLYKWVEAAISKIEHFKKSIIQIEILLKALKSVYNQNLSSEWSSGVLPCTLLSHTIQPDIVYSQIPQHPNQMLENLNTYLKTCRYMLDQGSRHIFME